MKKSAFAICLAFLALAATSCNREEKRAQEAADGYLQSMQKGDFDQAKEFVVTEGIDVVNIMQALSETTESFDDSPCTVESVYIIDDSSANVYYRKGRSHEREDTLVMEMKKRNEEWKVVPTKEDRHKTDFQP